ncbi:unnamed protein product [Amaranthus hypochondriacus]
MMRSTVTNCLMPSSFVQPHAIAQHQIECSQPQPGFNWETSSSYWPGSYHLHEDASNYCVPAAAAHDDGRDNDQVVVDDEEQVRIVSNQDYQSSFKLDLPDLNLDPSNYY